MKKVFSIVIVSLFLFPTLFADTQRAGYVYRDIETFESDSLHILHSMGWYFKRNHVGGNGGDLFAIAFSTIDKDIAIDDIMEDLISSNGDYRRGLENIEISPLSHTKKKIAKAIKNLLSHTEATETKAQAMFMGAVQFLIDEKKEDLKFYSGHLNGSFVDGNFAAHIFAVFDMETFEMLIFIQGALQ